MHDPEAEAARFLDGDLSEAEHATFSRHLLGCTACWREVEQARAGRAVLEAHRTVVPVALRDRVRALVEAEPRADVPVSPRAGRREARRALPAVAAATGLLLAGALLVRGPVEPAPLREAVADYAAEQLPGAALPSAVAPDLSALRLQPVGAGGGDYAGLAVDGYAYRDPAGRRVVVYLSDEPFPEAPGAHRLAGPDGPWIAERGDVVVLCASVPHALLVVGEDRALVRGAAGALGVL